MSSFSASTWFKVIIPFKLVHSGKGWGLKILKTSMIQLTCISVLGAAEKGDPLCKYIFKEAGVRLGHHVNSVETKVDEVYTLRCHCAKN